MLGLLKAGLRGGGEAVHRFARKLDHTGGIDALERRVLFAASLTVQAEIGRLNFPAFNVPLAVDGEGNLYGCDPVAGPFGDGSVFRVNPHNGAVWTLATFNGVDGTDPVGVVRDAAGNLFGTTSQGGKYGDGVVFEVLAGSNKLITLVTFNGSNGADPQTGLTIDSAGDVFGTTSAYEADINHNQAGSIFEIKAGTSVLTTLATFDVSQVFGVSGVTLDGKGNLYAIGGDGQINGDSDLLKVNISSKKLSFEDLPELESGDNVVIDSAGNIFGTGLYLGDNGAGMIFEIAAGSQKMKTIASFDNVTDGNSPLNLTMDAAGNLYGTNFDGYGLSQAFKFSSKTGVLTTLVGFPSSQAEGILVADASGDLYGLDTAFYTNQLEVYSIAGSGFVVPSVAVTAPSEQTAAAGVAKTFLLGSFTETGAALPSSVVVNWGDGTSVNKLNVLQPGVIPGYGHRYSRKGIFKGTISVTDLLGHTDEAVFEVVVK